MIVSHAALLVDVHAHPAAAVTATVPLELVAPTLAELDPMVGVHAAPACVTVNVVPAMVSVPVREVPAVFAATEYVVDPVPLPVDPAVIVSHAALLVDVHAQPVAAVTATVPVELVAPTLAEVEPMVGVQAAPA